MFRGKISKKKNAKNRREKHKNTPIKPIFRLMTITEIKHYFMYT